jgi:hypothetical protein
MRGRIYFIPLFTDYVTLTSFSLVKPEINAFYSFSTLIFNNNFAPFLICCKKFIKCKHKKCHDNLDSAHPFQLIDSYNGRQIEKENANLIFI